MPLFCDSISVRFLEVDRDTVQHLTTGASAQGEGWEDRHVSTRFVDTAADVVFCQPERLSPPPLPPFSAHLPHFATLPPMVCSCKSLTRLLCITPWN